MSKTTGIIDIKRSYPQVNKLSTSQDIQLVYNTYRLGITKIYMKKIKLGKKINQHKTTYYKEMGAVATVIFVWIIRKRALK